MAATSDIAFLRKFGLVIFGFVILTIALIYLGFSVTGEYVPAEAPSKGPLTESRIAPITGVRTSEAEVAAAAAAAPAADPARDPAAPIDGQAIYNSGCNACHDMAVAGAPKPGSPEMAERAQRGLDDLVATGIEGIQGTTMMPKGGRSDLSDEEFRAAVEFMIQ